MSTRAASSLAASASAAAPITVGSRVVVGVGNKKGEVMFIGETQFASGEWIGIRLDAPEGKNDGSLGDVRYFDCEANYGIFAKRV